MFSFMLYMTWLPDPNDSFKGVLGFVCLFGAFLVFSGRFVFWNVFGKESITVTRKSISYFRHYGLFRTPARVIPFSLLATEIEVVREDGPKEFGILNFYDRIETNLQLKQIFSTAVYLPVEQLREFEDRLIHLFQHRETDAQRWLSYSLN